MTVEMRKLGFLVGQKKVRTAMQVMGIEAIYPKPNLRAGNKQHKKFPYLLRDLVVDRSDQAWAADITYIPLVKGFGYLFAIIDWFSPVCDRMGTVKPARYGVLHGGSEQEPL